MKMLKFRIIVTKMEFSYSITNNYRMRVGKIVDELRFISKAKKLWDFLNK